jgi:pimeloyl-ACP methyl ester carboxylesterase
MTAMTPLVLIHGGTFDSRCWQLTVPHLRAPVSAVDLPGRGRRPSVLDSITLADCVDAIVEDMDTAGFDEAVLVAHSMGGVTLLEAMARAPERIRAAVFLSADIPPDGQSLVDLLLAEHASRPGGPDLAALASEGFRQRFGSDLDDDQYEWCMSLRVDESSALAHAPVDHSGLTSELPRIWIRATGDATNLPAIQDGYAVRVAADTVIDIDAGHMCMISEPVELAHILDDIAARS